MRRSKPVFQNVVDLGLRDVGVKNEPRRLAAHLGKATAVIGAFLFVALLAACAALRGIGAPGVLVGIFAAATVVCLFALVLITVKRSPTVAVKIDAGGTNHAT